MHLALNGYFWHQPRTGSGQYLRHLWDALHNSAGQGLSGGAPSTISLLLPASAGGDKDPVPQTRQARVIRARAPRVATGGNIAKVAWEQWGVSRLSREAGADLLHSPYLTAPLFKPCPVVVTAHDMIPWVVPGYRGSAAVRIYLELARRSVRGADLIIADSQASRRDVIKVLGVRPRKVHTVYLGVEPPPTFTREELDRVRSRFALPAHFAFYIGGFDRRKNVPLLLRSWHSALPQISNGGEPPVLAVAGSVPNAGGIFPDIAGQAEELGLGKESGPVRFLGRISEEDKPALMRAARLFVYPSSYEGFGLDPLEAMSVGCPVVSSSGGSLAEVVGDGGLLVPPDDETAFTAAVVRAWNSDDIRADLARRGADRARLFTWERTAQLTVNLYMHALKEAAGAKGSTS